MNVILREDIAGVGRRGDIVTVADGHARNYLLPRGLALVATEGAVNQANAMRRARDLREANDREAARTVAEALTARAFTVIAVRCTPLSTHSTSHPQHYPQGFRRVIH